MYPNHQGKYDALGIIYAHKQPCSFVMDKAKSNSFLVKELVDMLGAKRLNWIMSDKILPLSMRSQRKSSKARNTSCFQKVVMIGIATRYSNLSREVLNVRFVPKHRSYRLHWSIPTSLSTVWNLEQLRPRLFFYQPSIMTSIKIWRHRKLPNWFASASLPAWQTLLWMPADRHQSDRYKIIHNNYDPMKGYQVFFGCVRNCYDIYDYEFEWE